MVKARGLRYLLRSRQMDVADADEVFIRPMEAGFT